jgi:diguanylate cyclase (GGDEF)-like protein
MQEGLDIAPAQDEAGFRAYRIANIHAVDDAAFHFVALMLVLFNGWDWYIDPVNAPKALIVRLVGAVLIIASVYLQRRIQRAQLAPWIAKFRLLISAGSIATALSLLDQGFLVGISGLVAAVLGSAYVAVDRRDLFLLYLPALLSSVAIMLVSHLPRFVFVNALFFLALTLVVGWLLAAVLENSYRRAYQLEQALLRESRTDSLTGVDNRRALEEKARMALHQSQRSQRPLSVLLIDIDRFKAINDSHGHPAGDDVLRAVARQCRNLMRVSDHFGRWGGEEFLALLPDTLADQAAMLAERMRASIANTELRRGSAVLNCTVSIGVAGLHQPGSEDVDGLWATLVKAVDDAMYRAKAMGRNRVEGA